MPANWELRLISQILQEGSATDVIKAGLTPSMFTHPLSAEFLEYILDFYRNHGSVPSKEFIAERFPGIALPPPISDPISAIIDKVKEQILKGLLRQAAMDLGDLAEEDPLVGLMMLQETAVELTSKFAAGGDTLLGPGMLEVLDDYEAVKRTGGLTGVPYPWDILNQETGGMQDGELIVMYARPKNLKTWLLCYMAVYCYQLGYRVLFVTKEMTAKQICRRIAAIICKLDYKRFKQAKLSTAEEEHFKETVTSLANDSRFVITSERKRGAEGAGGVMSFRAKIDEVKPHVAFYDGLYLMSDDRSERSKKRAVDYKNIYAITQDTKELAQDMKLPVVVTNQQNRFGGNRGKGGKKEEDLSDLAFGDSFGQDADLLMRQKFDKKNKRLEIVLSGARETDLHGFIINAQLAGSFSFVSLINPDSPENECQPSNSTTGQGFKNTPPMKFNNRPPIPKAGDKTGW